MRSIKVKLVLAMGLLILISLGLLGGFNYWNVSKLLASETETNLTTLADTSADGLTQWLNIRKGEVGVLASSPILTKGNIDEGLAYLNEEVKRNKLYLRFLIVDEKGNAQYTNGTKANLADREYFAKAMAGVANISDPVLAKNDGKVVVVVAVPIKQGEKIVGVLGGTITVDDMIARVSAIKAGETGYGYVIQQDGLTIMHPKNELAMKENDLKDEKTSIQLKEATEKMVKGQKGDTQYSLDGVDRYLAYTPIAGTNWSLGVSVPVAEVTKKLHAFQVNSLVVTIIILFLSGCIGYFFSSWLAKPIRELSAATGRIAKGDLSVSDMKVTSKDELGQLAADFSSMTSSLRQLIRQVLQSAEQMAASSEQLTAGAAQSAQVANQVAATIAEVAQGTEKQLKSVDMTVTVVERLSSGIKQVAENAKSVSQVADQANQTASKGGNAIDKAINQMIVIEQSVADTAQTVELLGERSQQIGQIVETIAGIAGQTNLLALNAAIEAARAGEQGRGFAVVADEVRKLAEQSQEATKQIAELIGSIRQETERAVVSMNAGKREVNTGSEVVNSAGQNFREIIQLIEQLSSQVTAISEAIGQMSGGSQEIVNAVKEIDKESRNTADQTQTVSAATEEQSASMEEIAASSQALAKLAEDLQQAINKFTI
jgi:methyl-accepting chemotaxis protein